MFSRIKKFITDYKILEYLAYHDPLTGLFNRNWLYENIMSIKQNYVFFIDINNLHEINKMGHTVGDEHIVKIVKSISISDDDILVRYAGDEFVLFTNDKSKIYTNQIYSVGFSEINCGCISDAINHADQNMLISKSNWKTNNL
jgi:diguanylate cyclase (GGDEF)-like protein